MRYRVLFTVEAQDQAEAILKVQKGYGHLENVVEDEVGKWD